MVLSTQTRFSPLAQIHLRNLPRAAARRLWWLGVTALVRPGHHTPAQLQAAAAVLRAIDRPAPRWGMFLLAVLPEGDQSRIYANRLAIALGQAARLETQNGQSDADRCWTYLVREEPGPGSSGRQLLVEALDRLPAHCEQSLAAVHRLPDIGHGPGLTAPERIDLARMGLLEPAPAARVHPAPLGCGLLRAVPT